MMCTSLTYKGLQCARKSVTGGGKCSQHSTIENYATLAADKAAENEKKKHAVEVARGRRNDNRRDSGRT